MSAEVSETRNPPRRPRSKAVRRRRRRRGVSWLRPSDMGAAVVLVVVAVALVLATLSSLVYWRASSAIAGLERADYAKLATDTRNRIDRLVARDRDRMMAVSFNDSLYEAVGRLTTDPDVDFQPAFADWFPALFDDRFLAIYDLSGHHLYRWNDVSAESLEQSAVTNALFRMLDNREAVAGLVRQGERLYWVAGAPILPRRYNDARRPIRGYLLAAQPFRLSLLGLGPGDPGENLTLSSIDARQGGYPTQVQAAAGGDSARVRFGLADIFAAQNTRADLMVSRATYRHSQRQLLLFFIVSLLLIGGLAGTGIVLGRRWIATPVERLASALAPVQHGHTPSLLAPVSPIPEWRAAIEAVNRLLGHVRSTQERYDRAFDAVRDGIWEQDLSSGEWSFSRRFRNLLGYGEGDFPDEQESFVETLHPDDRDSVLEELQRCSGTGAPFSRELRLRRVDGEWAWFRIDAQVVTDHSGTPVRFLGRLVDLSDERRAEAAVHAARAEREADRTATGRFLAAIAGRAPQAADSTWGDDVALIGRGLAGTLEAHPAPFDVLELLQGVADVPAATPIEVAVAPGVPVRVEGDRDLIRRALVHLRENALRAAPRGRVSVLAERPDRREQVRFVVENRGGTLTDADRARAMRLLGVEGEESSDDPGLGLRVVREVARKLGGTTGFETGGDDATRVWLQLPLPEVVVKYEAPPPPPPEFVDEADATFTLPEAPAAAPASSPGAEAPPSAAPSLEIVADETVEIDLDATSAAPNGRPAETVPRIVEHLRANPENPLARQMATVFLKDGPTRLREAKGGLDAQEPATASGAAEGLKGMAELIGAARLAEGCERLEAAILVTDEPGARAVLAELAVEFARLRELIGPFVSPRPAAAAAQPASPPAIEPASLARLRSSLRTDGTGLGTQLVSLFLNETPARLETLDRATRRGDRDLLRITASELKDMCALVGAGPMGERCTELGRSPDPASVLKRVRAEFERARQVLEELLQAPTNA